MKKKSYLKSILMLLVIFAFGNNCNAFDSVNSSAWAQSRNQLNIKFYKTDSIVVVVPDNYILNDDDKRDAESYFIYERNFTKPVYVYKSESAINKIDKKKHLLFYGAYFHFKNYEFCNIPIKRTLKGFQFGNRKFEKTNEAFYFVCKDAQRMYVCKNSKEHRVSLFSKGIGKFQLHVFCDDAVLLTGSYF